MIIPCTVKKILRLPHNTVESRTFQTWYSLWLPSLEVVLLKVFVLTVFSREVWTTVWVLRTHGSCWWNLVPNFIWAQVTVVQPIRRMNWATSWGKQTRSPAPKSTAGCRYPRNLCKQPVLFLALPKETNFCAATTKPVLMGKLVENCPSIATWSWDWKPHCLYKESAAWKSRHCCHRQILPVAAGTHSHPQQLIYQQGYGFRTWFTCFVWLLDGG